MISAKNNLKAIAFNQVFVRYKSSCGGVVAWQRENGRLADQRVNRRQCKQCQARSENALNCGVSVKPISASTVTSQTTIPRLITTLHLVLLLAKVHQQEQRCWCAACALAEWRHNNVRWLTCDAEWWRPASRAAPSAARCVAPQSTSVRSLPIREVRGRCQRPCECVLVAVIEVSFSSWTQAKNKCFSLFWTQLI